MYISDCFVRYFFRQPFTEVWCGEWQHNLEKISIFSDKWTSCLLKGLRQTCTDTSQSRDFNFFIWFRVMSITLRRFETDMYKHVSNIIYVKGQSDVKSLWDGWNRHVNTCSNLEVIVRVIIITLRSLKQTRFLTCFQTKTYSCCVLAGVSLF